MQSIVCHLFVSFKVKASMLPLNISICFVQNFFYQVASHQRHFTWKKFSLFLNTVVVSFYEITYETAITDCPFAQVLVPSSAFFLQRFFLSCKRLHHTNPNIMVHFNLMIHENMISVWTVLVVLSSSDTGTGFCFVTDTCSDSGDGYNSSEIVWLLPSFIRSSLCHRKTL